MTDHAKGIDGYLRQLADGLDALGTAETEEVLLEVGSHLRDAMAEAGGDEAAALASFDAPDVLARRILEERGLLGGTSRMPAASGARRLAVLAIDVAVWLVLLWFVIFPFAAMGGPGYPSLTTRILAWSFLAAILAGTVWWWAKKRRERGHVTIGMRVVGVRRIRLGDSARMVCVRDLPGAAHGTGRRVVAVAATGLVLFFIGAMTVEAFSDDGSTTDSESVAAVEDVGYATAFVSTLYSEVLTGARSQDIESSYAPEAQAKARGLVARHAAGRIDTYSIDGLQLLSSAPPEEQWEDGGTYETVVLVRVRELQNDTVDSRVFEYRVVLTWEFAGGSAEAGAVAWEGGWTIASVKRL